jgi:hypothetical protein
MELLSMPPGPSAAMRSLVLLTLLLIPALLPVHAATDVKARPSLTVKKTPAAVAAKRKARPQPLTTAPVVSATGEGQAGYVHYWLITAPNGDQEIQVGIELPDQRIAWSFPGLGVHVAAFVGDGEVEVPGGAFKAQHLYGLRPYASEAAMRSLSGKLMQRVTPLVRKRVPYCELNGVTAELCMSCMGFVSQVLFPGRTPEYANFPRNFPRIAGEEYHTTEDLLLYLTGLHALPDAAARQRRIAALGGPPALQEELARLAPQLSDVAPTMTARAKAPGKRPLRPAPKTAIRRAG